MITKEVAASELTVGMFFVLAGTHCQVTEAAGLNAYGQIVIRFKTELDLDPESLDSTIILRADQILDTITEGPDPTWTPGKWFRVLDANGDLDAETSSMTEALELRQEDQTRKIQRMFIAPQKAEWRDF